MGVYFEGIIVQLCINSIAAIGISLLTGFTGIFSLGHAGYMAIGAYTTAILSVDYGLHWLPSVLCGGGVAMITAYLIGVPTLRLMGDYYSIASLGLGEAIRLIIENGGKITNGARGFSGIEGFSTLSVTVPFLIIMALGIFFLVNSSFGRSFKACRDDHQAASLLGINTARIRVYSLAISGLYCGVAGGLMAGYMSFIQPSMFDSAKSTELVAIVVFGGLGSMSGSVAGAIIMTLITETFRSVSQYRMFIYGAVLVLIMVLRPSGLLGRNELNGKFFSRLLFGHAKMAVSGKEE
jgi:branched-chain amino acid transport system permease protein